MASLPFDEIDVLIVDEMGKNVSGTGMDTNIIGRMMIRGVPEFPRPDARIVVVLDLTAELHGNGAGIGLADVLTLRAARKLDLRATYINGLTSGIGGVQRVRLPMLLPTDVDAICAGVLCCGQGDPAAGQGGADQEHPGDRRAGGLRVAAGGGAGAPPPGGGGGAGPAPLRRRRGSAGGAHSDSGPGQGTPRPAR